MKLKLKLPGDFAGGLYMFIIMFVIAIVEIYVLKDVQAFHGKGRKGKKGGRGGKGKGGKGRGKRGKGKGGKGGDEDGDGGNGGGGGNGEAKPTTKPTTTKAAAPTTTPAAKPATSNCSCMPMDSDPTRQKIETPQGVDCANHEYPGSVEECETLLATVANTPCCQGGEEGGSSEANFAYTVARMGRIIVA